MELVTEIIIFALAAFLVPDVRVGGFVAAIAGAFVVSAVGVATSWLTRRSN